MLSPDLVGSAGADTGDLTVLEATVVAPDGSSSQASVSLDQLLADPNGCPVYTGPDDVSDNAPHGRTASVTLVANDAANQGTWPLGSVLGCLQSDGAPAPITAGAVQAVVITGTNGTAESSRDGLLSGAADFASPSDFADPSEVPVISAQNPGQNPLVLYNRPARSSSDVNFPDLVSGANPIAVTVYEGQNPIRVTIAPPVRAKVTAGAQIQFSAQVSGDGSGLSYAWNFDGAAPDSADPTPTVTLTTAGVYDIGLQVTDADGDVGQAQPIQITVASAHPQTQTSTAPNTTTAPAGTGTSPTGPVTTAGHAGAGSTTTSRHTTTSGAQTPGPSTVGTTATSLTDTGADSPADTGATTAHDTSTSNVDPATPATTPAAQATPRSNTPVPTRPTPTARHRPPASSQSHANLKPVSGQLIAMLVPRPPSAVAAPGRFATGTGTPAALHSGNGASAATVLGGAVIAGLLLSLGALRELAGPLLRQRRARRSRSRDL